MNIYHDFMRKIGRQRRTRAIFSLAAVVAVLNFAMYDETHPLSRLLSVQYDNIAVIHVGVHNSGSAEIQMESKAKILSLKEDNYEMPWTGVIKLWEEPYASDPDTNHHWTQDLAFENQVNFAACFDKLDDQGYNGSLESRSRLAIGHHCNPNLLLSGLQIAKEGKNLLVSAEDFSYIDEEGFEKLESYLYAFGDHKIVLYYTHFFNWLEMTYDSKARYKKWLNDEDWESGILEFITKTMDPDAHFFYTVPVLERLQKVFSSKKIEVINVHSVNGAGQHLVENFYCEALPGANKTCEAIKNDIATNSGPSIDPHLEMRYLHRDFAELAHGAMKADMVPILDREGFFNVTIAIAHHFNGVLNQKQIGNQYDFQRVCPSPTVLNSLWEMSLDYHEKLYPHDGEDSNMFLQDMKQAFDKASTTSLCRVDVEHTLQQNVWQEFFVSAVARDLTSIEGDQDISLE
jgi:hypothetical protein